MKRNFILPIAFFVVGSLGSYSQSVEPTNSFDPTAATNSSTYDPTSGLTNPVVPPPPSWPNEPTNVIITFGPVLTTNALTTPFDPYIPPTSPGLVGADTNSPLPVWPYATVTIQSEPWLYTLTDPSLGPSTATISFNDTEFGVVEVPAMIDGYIVRAVGTSGRPLSYFSSSTFFGGLVTNVTLAEGISEIDPWAFANSQDLVAATIPDSVTKIGYNAFANCTNLIRIRIPAAFWNDFARLGLSTNVIIENATGGALSAALTQSFAQGANSITNQIEEARTAGRAEVTSNPGAFNLFTKEQFDSNRVAGQSDVINNPTPYGLHTSNSIMDLHMGGVIVQKNGTDAVVSFQPQTTTDLTQPFTNNGTPITHTIPMPENKGFIRINAKPVANPTPPQP